MDALLLPLQVLLMLGFAPLVQGAIKTSKGRWQSRQGPPLLQPYRDLRKLFARESVLSNRGSWLLRAAPLVYFAALARAAALVPTLAKRSPAPSVGDAIVFAGLLALGRFVLALASLDTASNFAGMGASRELTFSALVEPALIVALFAVALPAGSTNLTALVGDGHLGLAQLLALGALLIVTITETGRIPIDNPDTHLELTMAHEGMLLEYSGRPLGLLHWATMIKQLALFALIASFFFPWGMAAASDRAVSVLALGLIVFAAKAVLIGLVLGVVETSVAKLRIFRAPDLIGFASVLGMLAVLANSLGSR